MFFCFKIFCNFFMSGFVIFFFNSLFFKVVWFIVGKIINDEYKVNEEIIFFIKYIF